MRPVIQSVYLYQESELMNDWVYYRIASINSDEPAGTLGAPIEVCRVEWPTFRDMLPATDTQGITGLASAHNRLCRLVKQLWGVDHKKSVLIGVLSPRAAIRGPRKRG